MVGSASGPASTVPGPGGTALASGVISMQDLEKVLAPIRPASPVSFQYEWRRAPGMVMLAMPQGAADQATPWIGTINGFLEEGTKLSPLETDLAFCARDEAWGQVWPIATVPEYKPLSIPLGDAGIVMEIDQLRGQLVDLTILPDDLNGGTPTLVLPSGDIASFNVSLQLQNLHAQLRIKDVPTFGTFEITAGLDSLQANCVATLTPAPASAMPAGQAICGDQVFACVPASTTVTLGVLSTIGHAQIPDLVWLNSREELETFVSGALMVGLQLHFNNWAVQSLGARPNTSEFSLRGTSTLLPDGTSVCSPTVPPSPPEPPTRGLVSTRTRRGHGELYSSDGWVKPFFIEGELSAAFMTALGDVEPVVSRRKLPVAMDYAFDR